MKYEFKNSNGSKTVEVDASSEPEARKKAMIELHGRHKDAVVPHAPAYRGLGLSLTNIKE